MSVIAGFRDGLAQVNGQTIAFSTGGTGPALLLLHGFPQTRAMWHAIAPKLAERFTVIAADLRGYGSSSKPQNVADYSFRNMAADQTALMRHLGHDNFHLVGHDRGGRTAHRLALDSPEAVDSLTVMDIVPTHYLLSKLSKEVATAYYHWFFLAQPEPFPEHLIGADPDFYYESCLLGWGGSTLDGFDQNALQTYRDAWSDPDTIRGMCNDYRAALTYDFADDSADLGQRVACPSLVLYGAQGAMAQHYDVPATWASRLTYMQDAAIPGGHFFPDTNAQSTLTHMLRFLEGL